MQIINNSKMTPALALWQVRAARKWIPPLDLIGIEFLFLENKCPQPILDSNADLKNGSDQDHKIRGLYSQRRLGNPAQISLFLDDIYFPIPRAARLTPVPTLIIAHTLAHEVGHHLVRTRGCIFTPDEKYPPYEKKPQYEEEMANRYAFEIVDKMKNRLVYKFGAKITNLLADIYFGLALARNNAKKHGKAADSWRKSYILNPEKGEAALNYWRSLEKSNKNIPD